MKLLATAVEYEHSDPSGYRYTVKAVRDPERGWSASVSFGTSGFVTAGSAILHLRAAVDHFKRTVALLPDEE